MPALPVVNKVLRVSLTFALDQDLGARVGFFKRYAGVAPTNGQLNTFCDGIGDLFVSTDMNDLMNDTYSVTLIEATDLSSDVAAIGSDATERPGTRAGSVLPADNAVLCSHRVARRYRGGHPRNYWPFGSSGDVEDAQTWDGDFITNCDTAFDAFYGGINALGWASAGTIDSVNVSYYQGFEVFMGPTGRARNISTVRDEPVIDTITAHTASVGIASQRSRLLHLA